MHAYHKVSSLSSDISLVWCFTRGIVCSLTGLAACDLGCRMDLSICKLVISSRRCPLHDLATLLLSAEVGWEVWKKKKDQYKETWIIKLIKWLSPDIHMPPLSDTQLGGNWCWLHHTLSVHSAMRKLVTCIRAIMHLGSGINCTRPQSSMVRRE